MLSIVKRAQRFVCGLLTCLSLSAGAAPLLLSNARIIDPTVREDYVGYVLVDGATVVSIAKTRPPDYHGEEVDLTGKYLIPGLVDAHVHSEGNRAPIGEPSEDFGPEETARRMLYAGVIAYLDLGLDADTTSTRARGAARVRYPAPTSTRRDPSSSVSAAATEAGLASYGMPPRRDASSINWRRAIRM
jgi:imidazolonepropionase-like amidohydrolase